MYPDIVAFSSPFPLHPVLFYFLHILFLLFILHFIHPLLSILSSYLASSSSSSSSFRSFFLIPFKASSFLSFKTPVLSPATSFLLLLPTVFSSPLYSLISSSATFFLPSPPSSFLTSLSSFASLSTLSSVTSSSY